MVQLKYFPIYIDILGYEEKAIKDAKKIGLDEKDIRHSYIQIIENRLDDLTKINVIAPYNKKSDIDYTDEWIVYSGSIWTAFKCVGEVIKSKLPLALAIGVIETDDKYLIGRSNEVIAYLKTFIIPKYEKFYKEKHGNPLKQTFLLLTPEAYNALESRKICSKPYPSAEFYLVELEKFDYELKVIKFLEKIGSQRKEYRRIAELYVPPQNYNEIKNKLEEHNLVFIIGDAEMGKTYTSIRLMWELFEENYEPIYFQEERRREQWDFIRHQTEYEGKVIYLEDPWGKVEFEKIESLFRDMETFILEAKTKNCKIIVTSREKVFKEFEKRKETSDNLWEFVTLLKVNLSYTNKDLLEILKKYIEVFEPIWSVNEKLRKITFDSVGRVLRTPMSIKKLIEYSKNTENEQDIRLAIVKAAENTKIAFAKEIQEIFNKEEYDKLVFLSFPYIGINTRMARLCYEKILIDIGYNLIKAKTFDKLLEDFSEVEKTTPTPKVLLYGWNLTLIKSMSAKVSIKDIHNYIDFRGKLRYIHPSYQDAFKYALIEEGKPNNISTQIFCKVLLRLSNCDEAARDTAIFITKNFNFIPEHVRNELLSKLFDKDDAALIVAVFVMENFGKLGGDSKSLIDKWQPLILNKIEEFIQNGQELKAIELFSKTIPKIDKQFALKILYNLSKNKNVKVRKEAKKQIEIILTKMMLQSQGYSLLCLEDNN